MTENPFRPPTAEVETAEESKQRGSLWKGVLLGGVADFGGTLAMGTIMFIIFLVQIWSPEMTPEQMERVAEEYTQLLSDFDNIWSLLGLVFGLGFSVLGGFVCAIFAKERWKNAVLILASILSVYGLLAGSEYYQLGVNIVLVILSFMSIYLGGWLRARMQAQKASSESN